VRTVRWVAGVLLIGVSCAWVMLPPSTTSSSTTASTHPASTHPWPSTGGTVAEEHDFWLAPSSYRPAIGSAVDVSLLVGHPSRYTPYVRNPQHIRRFVAAFGDSLHIIRGVAGRDPAGTITFDRPGLAVVGYSSRHTATSLPASRFEAYLREEGLDHVIESRERRGETLAPGREKFSRSAKSILQVGGLGLEGYDRRLGFPFEIVPERNPYELAQGDSLPVRLYFRGRPLGGALVTAYQTKSSQVEATGRSDANGLVLLAIDRPGEWMIKSVHMVSVEGDPAADWESIWATLTFERTLRADSALR
jgi:uncharacterized GH25 family protein